MSKKISTVVLGSLLLLATLVLAQDGEGASSSMGSEQVLQELQSLRQRVQRLETQLREFALRHAHEQLRGVQADLQEGRSPEEIGRQVERIRAGLEQAYVNTGDFDIDQQALGKELTTHFDALARQIEGGEDPSAGVEALASGLEAERRRVARAHARQELQALQQDVQAGQRPPGELAAQARRIRTGLERAYASTGGTTAEQPGLGENVGASFDALGQRLEAGESGAAELETLMNELAATDDQGAPAQDTQDADGTENTVDGRDSQDTQDTQDAQTQDENAAQDEDADAADQEQTDEATSADAAFEWRELGQQVYSNSCAVCHQATGEGIEGAYPALAGNPFVTGAPVPVIETVLHGRGGMPAFEGGLSAEEIAAVISHERNSWGNEATVITPEVVRGVSEGESVDELLDTLERPGAAN